MLKHLQISFKNKFISLQTQNAVFDIINLITSEHSQRSTSNCFWEILHETTPIHAKGSWVKAAQLPAGLSHKTETF